MDISDAVYTEDCPQPVADLDSSDDQQRRARNLHKVKDAVKYLRQGTEEVVNRRTVAPTPSGERQSSDDSYGSDSAVPIDDNEPSYHRKSVILTPISSEQANSYQRQPTEDVHVVDGGNVPFPKGQDVRVASANPFQRDANWIDLSSRRLELSLRALGTGYGGESLEDVKHIGVIDWPVKGARSTNGASGELPQSSSDRGLDLWQALFSPPEDDEVEDVEMDSNSYNPPKDVDTSANRLLDELETRLMQQVNIRDTDISNLRKEVARNEVTLGVETKLTRDTLTRVERLEASVVDLQRALLTVTETLTRRADALQQSLCQRFHDPRQVLVEAALSERRADFTARRRVASSEATSFLTAREYHTSELEDQCFSETADTEVCDSSISHEQMESIVVEELSLSQKLLLLRSQSQVVKVNEYFETVARRALEFHAGKKEAPLTPRTRKKVEEHLIVAGFTKEQSDDEEDGAPDEGSLDYVKRPIWEPSVVTDNPLQKFIQRTGVREWMLKKEKRYVRLLTGYRVPVSHEEMEEYRRQKSVSHI
ncbi:MAG: uncharacterized protein KVP18_003056 [Porospora cf. gigantea A]|uniref:uncharacterized protein n=1 Tax=Porospora cf. gigantea A TaxID=2853593 RepID=UPI0035594A93|nr:MAG: hypothetical protein KVP18_003056 [Porospora cf. gigantea A]